MCLSHYPVFLPMVVRPSAVESLFTFREGTEWFVLWNSPSVTGGNITAFNVSYRGRILGTTQFTADNFLYIERILDMESEAFCTDWDNENLGCFISLSTLTAHTEYNVSVTAFNDVGEGEIATTTFTTNQAGKLWTVLHTYTALYYAKPFPDP